MIQLNDFQKQIKSVFIRIWPLNNFGLDRQHANDIEIKTNQSHFYGKFGLLCKTIVHMATKNRRAKPKNQTETIKNSIIEFHSKFSPDTGFLIEPMSPEKKLSCKRLSTNGLPVKKFFPICWIEQKLGESWDRRAICIQYLTLLFFCYLRKAIVCYKLRRINDCIAFYVLETFSWTQITGCEEENLTKKECYFPLNNNGSNRSPENNIGFWRRSSPFLCKNCDTIWNWCENAHKQSQDQAIWPVRKLQKFY